MLSNFSISILLIFSIFILIRQITTVATMWKLNGITILPHVFTLFILILLGSCSKDEILPDTCIGGDCSANFETVSL